MKTSQILAVMAVAVIAAQSASAAVIRFTRTGAGTDNLWTNVNNWTNTAAGTIALPGPADTALINKYCILDAPYTTAALGVSVESNKKTVTSDFNSGANLLLTANLRVGGGNNVNTNNTGILNINSNALITVKGSVSIPENAANSRGHKGFMNINAGGTAILHGDLSLGSKTNCAGTLTVNAGGTVTATNSITIGGSFGPGTLIINTGGLFETGTTTKEFNVGVGKSIGTLTVAGKLLTKSSNFDIATGTASTPFYTGTVHVASTGLFVNEKNIRIAQSGPGSQGTMTVEGVVSNTLALNIGSSTDSTRALCIVSNSAALLFSDGTVRVQANGGSAELRIVDGLADIDNNIMLSATNGGTVAVNISGGELIVNQVNLASDGVITLTGGKMRVMGATNVAWSGIDGYIDLKSDDTPNPGVLTFPAATITTNLIKEWIDEGRITNTVWTGTGDWYVLGIDGNGDAYVTVFDSAADQYAVWAAAYGLTGGRTGDDDTDGLLNVYEYGLGGDPTNSASLGNQPVSTVVAGGFQYTHAKLNDASSGVTYAVEVTDSLVFPSWTNLGVTVTGTGTIDAEFDAVTNQISTAVKDAQFIRLIIE